MICAACGEPNQPGAEFCSSCQAFLGWDKKDETTAKPKRAESSDAAAATTQVLPTVPSGPRPAEHPAVSPGVSPTPVDRLPEAAPPAPRSKPRPASPVTPLDVAQTCPSCRRSNPAERRFCSRCGAVLPAHPLNGVAPTVVASTSDRARERAARKAYKRSLPTIYRFRRVGIVVLVLAVVAAAIALVDRPVRTAMDTFFTIRNDYQPVTVTALTVEPADQAVNDTVAPNLIDRESTPLSLAWNASTSVADCGTPGPAVITVRFAATRVRGVLIYPDQPGPVRNATFAPTRMLVAVPGTDRCQIGEIDQEAQSSRIEFDSVEPVTELTLAVAGARGPTVADAHDWLDLQEIRVEKFPR